MGFRANLSPLECRRIWVTGSAFSGNRIPASRIDPNGQAILKLFPEPNALDRRVTRGAYNYQYQANNDSPKRSQLLKLDYRPTDKDTVALRPRRWRADQKTLDYGSGFSGVPLAAQHNLFTDSGANASWTRIVSPTVVNEANVGFRGMKEVGLPNSSTDFTQITRAHAGITLGQLHPESNPYGFVPAVSFSGVPSAASISTDGRMPKDGGDARLYFSNNLSLIHLGHTLKFGAYFEESWNCEGLQGKGFNGQFDFGRDTNNPLDANWPYATAILGNFTSYTETSNKTAAAARMKIFEWFGQDTWKATRRLTLNYGMRFSWFTPWQLRRPDGAAFALERYAAGKAPQFYWPALDSAGRRVARSPITGALAPAVLIGAFVPGTGDPVNGMVLPNDNNYPNGFRRQQPVQLAPRLGMAYDVFGDGKLALRGGFGMARQAVTNSGNYASGLGGNPPAQFVPKIFWLVSQKCSRS